eukprot:Em0072g18a
MLGNLIQPGLELKVISLSSTSIVGIVEGQQFNWIRSAEGSFSQVIVDKEDISTRLTGAKVFSTLDANHGYWHIPMDPASQRLTTFNTMLGRYCYTRMPFDVKSAQEIFQKRMVQHFGDLRGVETDIDDILEWGATKEEHNQRLKAVLQRCNDIHMKSTKCPHLRTKKRFKPKGTNDPWSYPWEEIATDLFHWSDHDYLIIVDYFSRYIELCKPENTSCKSIVTHTTSVLARHGIPMVIRSDNGPQYTAEEYKRFTREWGIQHVTTHLYHPQANGLAEKSVQIIQSLLNKSKANNQDPYLSLLEYRSTTVDNVGSSAQLLMGRNLEQHFLSQPHN